MLVIPQVCLNILPIKRLMQTCGMKKLEVMARGTFANIRIVNKLLNREVGPKTVHIPTGEKLYMFDAAIGEGDCNAKLGITILGEAVNVEDEVVVINSIVLPNKTLNSCYTKLLCLRRLAYVEFMRKEAAEHALSLDGTSFMSRILKILVATPGRLKDHIENTTGFATRLMGVKVMVLDEADHLLDMGFCKDIEKIIVVVPKERQTLLFSATVLRYSKSPASTLLILAYH